MLHSDIAPKPQVHPMCWGFVVSGYRKGKPVEHDATAVVCPDSRDELAAAGAFALSFYRFAFALVLALSGAGAASDFSNSLTRFW